MKNIINILSKNIVTLIVSILLLLSLLLNIWLVLRIGSNASFIGKIDRNQPYLRYTSSFSPMNGNSHLFYMNCVNGECKSSATTTPMTTEEIQAMQEKMRQQQAEMQKRIDAMNEYWDNHYRMMRSWGW